jgi:hypothetical protein
MIGGECAYGRCSASEHGCCLTTISNDRCYYQENPPLIFRGFVCDCALGFDDASANPSCKWPLAADLSCK